MRESSAEWLRLGEVAQLLGVHPTTVRTWADKGDIPVHRTAGGHRRFRRSEVEVWAAAKRTSQPGNVQVVVLSAIGRTRTEAAEGRLLEQDWYRKLDDLQRTLYRRDSHRLLRELSQYVTSGGEQGKSDADRLGRHYARRGQESGLSLKETVEAFLFFREFLMESIFNVYETAGVRLPEAWAELRRRAAQYTDLVLLALIDAYAQNPRPA